ncbi:unnamed protein product [Anisakis simplex]|uniref:Uncharacterized protein n=1 Tax=Anisakis simplex TaxID=6269 RepID=A0A0M3JTY7_ANISI|nr:unnamed protein product [Anisakis simplex]
MNETSSKWPSKSSILETPERKRYRLSTSFADSGLGSSIFGSPPAEQISGSTNTSPLLRTPTTKTNGSRSGSESTPSPLRSFIHISSYSSSFSSPELRASPSDRNLRLSNPANAIGFRFSGGAFMKATSSDLDSSSVHQGRSLTDERERTSTCCARPINRSLQLSPATTSYCVKDENNVGAEEANADVTIPYAQPETPSKGFGVEMLERRILAVDDAFRSVTTSTPLREVEFTSVRIPSIDSSDIYRVPEQANGPLESSICDHDSLQIDSSATEYGPLQSQQVATIYSSQCSPFIRSPLKTFSSYQQCAVSSSEQMLSASNSLAVRVDANSQVCKPELEDQPLSENAAIFRTPKRRPKPYSRGWMQIACGRTAAQLRMTRLAREFLNSQQPLTRSSSSLTDVDEVKLHILS